MLLVFVLRSVIRNPHKFNIKTEMDGQYYNLWSTDNERTDNNDGVVIKSVYDPSPVGYSLPASNAFTGFTKTGQNTWNSAEWNVKGNFDNGWYFYTKPNKQGDTLFFRISGVRNPDSGIVDRFLEGGYFWTIGITDQHIGRSTAFENFSVRTVGFSFPSWAFAVRSAEEMKLKCWLEEISNDV